MTAYKEVKLNVSAEKAKKLASLKPVNLTASELKGTSDSLYVHPANYEKIMKAKRSGKGVRIQLAEGEIIYDMEERQGASIWSWMKNKAFPWLKRNYDVIKPLLSRVADTAIPAVATAFGQPELAVPARGGLRALTGVGVGRGAHVKGSEEARQYMAHIRSMRGKKSGGSFRL